MHAQSATPAPAQEGFTVEMFAGFWAAPEMSEDAAAPLAEDIVGYWPGEAEPVRGLEAYVGALAELLRIVPDLRLTVDESAQEGDVLFISWVAHASDAAGNPVEHTGCDRIKVRDGLIVENRIYFDRGDWERKLGRSLELG